jgi:hypothetical protein
MPKPEAFSRVLIDQALKESDWDLLDDRRVRFELDGKSGHADCDSTRLAASHRKATLALIATFGAKRGPKNTLCTQRHEPSSMAKKTRRNILPCLVS